MSYMRVFKKIAIAALFSLAAGLCVAAIGCDGGGSKECDHSYDAGNAIWTWTETDDGYDAYMTVQCIFCGDKKDIEASVLCTDTATCLAAGTRTYTATAMFEGVQYTQTKSVISPKTDHEYLDPKISWSGGALSGGALSEDLICSFVFTCKNCGNVETVEAEGVYEKTTANCYIEGSDYYTASCTFNGKMYSDETSVYVGIRHTYGEPVWTWDLNESQTMYNKATATFTCTICENEDEEPGEITYTSSSSSGDPCTDENTITAYSATIDIFGETYTSNKSRIGALGHDLEYVPEQQPYVCLEGYIECWKCSRCLKYFDYADKTKELSEDEVLTPATAEHSYDIVAEIVSPYYEGSEDRGECIVQCSVCGTKTRMTVGKGTPSSIKVDGEEFDKEVSSASSRLDEFNEYLTNWSNYMAYDGSESLNGSYLHDGKYTISFEFTTGANTSTTVARTYYFRPPVLTDTAFNNEEYLDNIHNYSFTIFLTDTATGKTPIAYYLTLGTSYKGSTAEWDAYPMISGVPVTYSDTVYTMLLGTMDGNRVYYGITVPQGTYEVTVVIEYTGEKIEPDYVVESSEISEIGISETTGKPIYRYTSDEITLEAGETIYIMFDFPSTTLATLGFSVTEGDEAELYIFNENGPYYINWSDGSVHTDSGMYPGHGYLLFSNTGGSSLTFYYWLNIDYKTYTADFQLKEGENAVEIEEGGDGYAFSKTFYAGYTYTFEITQGENYYVIFDSVSNTELSPLVGDNKSVTFTPTKDTTITIYLRSSSRDGSDLGDDEYDKGFDTPPKASYVLKYTVSELSAGDGDDINTTIEF